MTTQHHTKIEAIDLSSTNAISGISQDDSAKNLGIMSFLPFEEVAFKIDEQVQSAKALLIALGHYSESGDESQHKILVSALSSGLDRIEESLLELFEAEKLLLLKPTSGSEFDGLEDLASLMGSYGRLLKAVDWSSEHASPHGAENVLFRLFDDLEPYVELVCEKAKTLRTQ